MKPAAPPAASARRPPKPGWILGGLLLAVYAGIKLLGWGCARQAMSLERQLEELRPALSAIVLAEQLENTRRACQEVASRTRQLDVKTSRLFAQLSSLPASITLTGLELHSRLSLPVPGTFSVPAQGPGVRSAHDTRIRGTLLPGVRDPETVLVRWAQTLQAEGSRVVIQKLAPSFEPMDLGLWEFDLEIRDA